MSITDFQEQYRGKKGSENAVMSTKGGGHKFTYKPSGKDERAARKRVWDRYCAMKDSDQRKEAEKRWNLGDKMYRMWVPDRNPDDWQADVVLPDGFAAVQTHMQETIQLRPRPSLDGVENSDEALRFYVNHVFHFAMDKTDFDPETYKARNCSAIRGDAYTREEYRYEKRTVQDPVSVEKGEIKYKKREICDYDDVYTRWIDNWAVFFDDTVDDFKYARDWVYREVMSYEDFKEQYMDKPGFMNCDLVVPASSVPKNAGFFKKSDEIADGEVEVLHYENKNSDSYDVLANNVLIRKGPLPNRHKELSLDKWTFYPIPGEAYGMGIPYIIYTLVEERRSGRNIALDRNKLANHKMFLVNDLFDLDEDDLTPRPHGMVKVNTNGLPIQQAIQALEYNDVPASSIRMDDTLLMEERRAHGLDDRPAQTAGGTATESAIISEAAQKRINLINTLQNWTTLKSIGRKKWSNIQFFYPAGREEEIMEDNKWKKKMVYKTIKIDGREFKLKGDPTKGEEVQLMHAPYDGSTRITLDPTFARYLEGNFDIIVEANSNIVESPAVKFARVSEMVLGLLNNPMTARELETNKTVKRLFSLANEDPRSWMRAEGMTDADFKALAELENGLFLQMANSDKIYQLPGTPGATQAHTEEHLNFVNSPEYEALPQVVKDIVSNHIMEENENNPNTPSNPDMMKALTAGAGPEQGGGGNAVLPGNPGGPAPTEIPVGGGTAVGGDVTAGNVVA